MGWVEARDMFVPPALVVLAAIPIAHRSGVRTRTILVVIAGLVLLTAFGLYVLWLSFRNFAVE